MSKLGILLSSIALPAAVLASAAPAVAQPTVEEVTVTGRYGPGETPRALSQAVSFADLDLSLASDQALLKHRVKLTARYLCDKLGENETGSSVAPSCRTAAERDAMTQVDNVLKGFPPRGPKWARAQAWTAPYPPAWVETYP